MTTREHIAREPLPAVLEDREQSADGLARAAGFLKPVGLWYGVNGDWRRWCLEEDMPDWIDGRLAYPVDLGSANMLFIRTVSALDRFHARYSRPAAPELPSFVSINWAAVAAEYDGIEIAPYQWRRRFDSGFMWYYGWDCASGCVWRASRLKLGEPVRVQLDGAEVAR